MLVRKSKTRRLYEDIAPLMCYRYQTGLLDLHSSFLFSVSMCTHHQFLCLVVAKCLYPVYHNAALWILYFYTQSPQKHLVHFLNRTRRAVVVDYCYSIGYFYAFVCFWMYLVRFPQPQLAAPRLL